LAYQLTGEEKIMRSMRGFINIEKRRESKVASMCYPGMCGSMISTIKWAHRYAKKDTDFALKVLDLAIKEREKVEHVIKRFNRRFN
jgi:hypothetical protein|tara:strand:- start:43 stop:300 length:258 start_codon:yes stop_codon:yes gene_type:complete